MLLDPGTFSYNGIPWTSLYKSKVEVKPVKDSAGRALVTREYTLDVDGYIAASAIPAASTDNFLQSLRLALQQPAGALVYKDKGYGNLSVNVPGGNVWDAAYGPWPDVLSWQPVGNTQGCLVRWRCTALVPCEESPFPKGILEYCWTEAWDNDEDGYTKRVIDGHLTVQATRATVKTRTIPDNADAYLDKIVPDLPPGFRRVEHRDLSEDKRTLKFRFEDEELPLPLPDGVSRAEVRHKVRWSLPSKDTKQFMVSTIGGSITLPARTPKNAIWDRILLILRSRWPLANGPINNAAGQGNLARQTKYLYFLKDVEIDDEVFGRSTSFSATCWIMPQNDKDKTLLAPQSILLASGMWAPIPGTSFAAWRQSMFQPHGAGKAFAPRGMAGMSFQNGDDAIVDLCANSIPRVLQTAPGATKSLSGRGIPATVSQGQPDPNNSWLRYGLRLRVREDDRVTRHKPLQGITTVKQTPVPQGITTYGNSLSGSLSAPPASMEDTEGQDSGATGGSPDIVQRVSAPSFTMRLEGYAVRIGYMIPTPRLATVGGVAVTQQRQNVSQEQVSQIGGLPIYAASWAIDYLLPTAPQGELPMPLNPVMV